VCDGGGAGAMREGRARQYREYCKRGRQSSAPAAPRPEGLRPKSPLTALFVLPIFAIWAATSASPPTILASTQHAFDYEIGSNQAKPGQNRVSERYCIRFDRLLFALSIRFNAAPSLASALR